MFQENQTKKFVFDPTVVPSVKVTLDERERIYSYVALPGGQLAIGLAKVITLWHVDTGRREKVLSDHDGAVYDLAVLPNGQLASASADKTIKLWNVDTGKCERTLAGHKASLDGLAVLPSGKLVSRSYEDGTIRVWSVITGLCENTLSDSCKPRLIKALPSGKLVSMNNDGRIRVWNVDTGKCEKYLVLGNSSDSSQFLEVLPDGRLASLGAIRSDASNIGRIMVWNVDTGACERTLWDDDGRWILFFNVLPNGRLAIVSGATEGQRDHVRRFGLYDQEPTNDRRIKIFNIGTGRCERMLEGHQANITSLAVLPSGQLVSGSKDCTIRIWNMDTGVCEKTLKVDKNHATDLFILPNGRVLSKHNNGNVLEHVLKIWDLGLRPIPQLPNQAPIKLVPPVNRVEEAARFQENQAQKFVFDPSVTPHEEKTLSGHSDSVGPLTLLSDGRLASGSMDETIKLWSVSSGECESTLSGHHGGPISTLTLLLDGRLASGSWDKTIKLWNVSSGLCESTLSGHHGGPISTLTLLLDGRLVSGSSDKTIKLWNVSSGLCESTLSGHSDAVFALTLLSDGRLASGSKDNTIKLWNVFTGACESTLSGHSKWVYALTLLSDGRLASGSRDNTIKLWNVLSGECESTLSGHRGAVFTLTLLSDGRLVSGGQDNTIKLWDVGLRLAPRVVKPLDQASIKSVPPVNHAEEVARRDVEEAAKKFRIEQMRIAKEKAEQEERELKEREIKEAQEKVAASPKSQRQRLRDSWESPSSDDILKGYEALITLAPSEGINYRERGEYYVYKAKNSKTARQQKGCYEKALADFNKAMECNIADDVAAERYEQVEAQLNQLSIASNTSSQKLSSSEESNHSTSLSPHVSSPHFSTETPSQENKNIPATVFNLPSLYISADKITRGAELGKGGFGTVYAGQYNFQTVAVKCYEGSRLPERVAAEVRHEVEVMLKLQHECLVRLLGLVQLDIYPAMLVMEYGANGSLYHYLHSSQEISWSLRLRIAKELARGLAYLHQENIIHRDIKSLNVVLNEDYHAKWCDFGLAVLKLHSTTTTKQSSVSAAGTDRWKAPELFTGEASHSVASDIWALGMIYFELASRHVPFFGAEGLQLVSRIALSNPKGETIPADCLREAPKFAELMQRCWQERTARPSAIELVQALEAMTVVANQTQSTTGWARIDSLNSRDVPTLSSEASFFDAAKETKLNANNIGLKK